MFSGCLAVVTEDLGPSRWCERPTYTLAVLLDSGAVRWPVERFETDLNHWANAGRRVP